MDAHRRRQEIGAETLGLEVEGALELVEGDVGDAVDVEGAAEGGEGGGGQLLGEEGRPAQLEVRLAVQLRGLQVAHRVGLAGRQQQQVGGHELVALQVHQVAHAQLGARDVQRVERKGVVRELHRSMRCK